MSFGRHGRYGRDTPIDRLSMLEAYLSGRRMFEKYPPFDTIFYSPIARAVQTAEFRALGSKCEHLIESEKISEDTPTFEIRKFINLIISQSSDERHYHFVTHLPVIEKLGLGEIGCGDICLCEADNWQEMLADNFKLTTLKFDLIDDCVELLNKMNLSAQQFDEETAEDIYTALINQQSRI